MSTRNRILLIFAITISICVSATVFGAVFGTLYYGKPLLSPESGARIEGIISGLLGFICGALAVVKRDENY
jgi:hypothetical protein